MRRVWKQTAFWVVVVAVAAWAIALLVVALPCIDRPFPGFKPMLDRTVDFETPDPWTGIRAGLRPPDRIDTVEGKTVTSGRAITRLAQSVPLGTPMTYGVDRVTPDGVDHSFFVTVPTERYSLGDWLVGFLSYWLAGLAYLAIGTLVSVLRPGPVARAHFRFCVAGALTHLAMFDGNSTYLFSPFWLRVLVIVAAGYFATDLAAVFPRPLPAPWRERLRRANLLLAAATVAFCVFGAADRHLTFWTHILYPAYPLAAGLVLLGNALWVMVSRQTSLAQRAQARILLLGVAVTGGFGSVMWLGSLGGLASLTWVVGGISAAALPVAIGYAIVRHGLFDIEFDREAIEARFSRDCQEAHEISSLVERYLFALSAAFGCQWAMVFHRDGTIAASLGTKPILTDPAVAVPLRVWEADLGMVHVGPKVSQLSFTRRDRQFLDRLSDHLAVWLHVHDRLESDRHLQRQVADLERARQIQDQFLSLVSHELRSPLSAIVAAVSLMKVVGDLSEQDQARADRIALSAHTLARLVDDLLYAGQLESGHFKLDLEPTDAGEIAEEAIAALLPLAAENGQVLTCEIADDLPLVTADSTRLAQVMRNLIHNAIKYSPEDTPIAVRLSHTQDTLVCEVEDQGPGLSDDEAARLFERFVQLPSTPRKGGVGLGLFIARELVSAHGGTIGVRSEPGCGSTFHFSLPLAPRSQTADRPAGPPSQG